MQRRSGYFGVGVICSLAVLAAAAPASAQNRGAARGWFDVNFGTTSMAANEQDRVVTQTVFGETASFTTTYNQPTGAHFDIGGGYMFRPRIGAGVSFSGDASQGEPDLGISIPHPLYFNAFASDAVPGDTSLMRTESAVNMHVMLNVIPFSNKFQFRVFGGPTYYRVNQEAVTDIRYSQSYQVLSTANSVSITTYDFEEVHGNGWGYHVGADAAVFFSDVVGIGFGMKYAGGSVTLNDGYGDFDSDAGGFNAFGGLRLRFGR